MLNIIKEFLSNLKPNICVQAPSRINLINPLDAVEGDYWMPSVAINGKNDPLSAFLYIKRIEHKSKLKIYKIDNKPSHSTIKLMSEERLMKKKIYDLNELNAEQRLIYASINRLLMMNSDFKRRYFKATIEIGLLTTIPQQSGLGGSTAIIISVLYGLACYFNLYKNINNLKDNEFPINKDIIAEIATKVEDKDLEITAGYSDRYVISRGGLGFCSYVGKLYHKKISDEPLAVYDRIDKTYKIRELPIIICFSGEIHESGEVHNKLRKLYLKNEPEMIKDYMKLAKISWKSRFAFMKHDWNLLGRYFKENTKIMNKIMKNAGFEHGIGMANNILIEIIEENPNVYAAKLTGAGNGGSVFALANRDKVKSVLNYWKKKLNEIIGNKQILASRFPSYPLYIVNNLKNAKFYQATIHTDGVKKI